MIYFIVCPISKFPKKVKWILLQKEKVSIFEKRKMEIFFIGADKSGHTLGIEQMVIFSVFLVTRSILSAFEREQFPNPTEAAKSFLSVGVVIKKIPELEARMSLLTPPIIRKRRRSTRIERYVEPAIKKRRISVFLPSIRQQVQQDLVEATVRDIPPANETGNQNDDNFEPSTLVVQTDLVEATAQNAPSTNETDSQNNDDFGPPTLQVQVDLVEATGPDASAAIGTDDFFGLDFDVGPTIESSKEIIDDPDFGTLRYSASSSELEFDEHLIRNQVEKPADENAKLAEDISFRLQRLRELQATFSLRSLPCLPTGKINIWPFHIFIG